MSKLLAAVKKHNFTFNENKSIISIDTVKLLGYVISHKSIKPDPERLEPLRNMHPPKDQKSKQMVIGMFSYYSQFIKNFPDKIQPLVKADTYPINPDAENAFYLLKKDIEASVVTSLDETLPFVVETGASDHALAATLSQNGHPVAFFSKTLSKQEIQYPPIKKEAYAIVEAIRKWRHYLTGQYFTLITDQKAVSFMFDQSKKGKIKNNKIMRWRTELSCYSFNIQHRPVKDNVVTDCLSRDTAYSCSTLNSCENPLDLHKA